MNKTSTCIKVSKTQGEKVIALVNELGVFDKSLLIRHNGEDICIPITRQLENNELAKLKTHVPDSELETDVFVQKQPTADTLMQSFEEKLPSHLLASVPQALDVVGDIAIVEIPPELEPHQDLVGDAILKLHKNVRTVLAKAGSVSGTFRLREFTFVAGERKTKTVHREFGCQFHVDVAKAYFSPRLSHEHMRVASLVQAGETVVDFFAGVGPFSVLIGKRNPNVRVYALDINPDAVELLKVNVRANRVENRVFPIFCDARKLAATKLKGSADRVIMNLPETAIEFVDAACQTIKPQGGVIHFYGFVRSPDSIENLKQRFCAAVEKADRRVETFLCARSVRETAPYEFQVVLDAKIV
jgi:tRNA (guanine37-N1)-methyltransferase